MVIIKHFRKVQSFARRVRRLTSAQIKTFSTLGPKYLLPSEKKILNFLALYGNSDPVILEIGFGMGHSLLAQARENPENNYLGFEVHQPGVAALLVGIEQETLTNIRVIADDMVLHLDRLPDASLKGVQIFFPDPWPKRRHHKRRLIQVDFLKRLATKLELGGFLHCATDWQDYAEHMLHAIDESHCFSKAAFVPRPKTRPVTKFEKRGMQLGHRVWDVIVTSCAKNQ